METKNIIWIVGIVTILIIAIINLFAQVLILNVNNTQPKPKNCLDNVEIYCYNLFGETGMYNDCKWTEFPKRCPQECLEYFDYLRGFPEQYNKEIKNCEVKQEAMQT